MVRNGLEGGIAFPLKRAAKILCSRKNARGEYERSEFEFWAEKEYNISIPVEEKLNPPVLDENIRLIQEFDQHGATDQHVRSRHTRSARSGTRTEDVGRRTVDGLQYPVLLESHWPDGFRTAIRPDG